MAKPAIEARLAAAAKGYTQVIGRGNAHIVTRNPANGKCAYDGQVGGGWHYNGDQETDTAWMQGTAPWNWQMVKANYNLFALSQLNQGQVIKWLDPASGQSVTFQPMALQWTNALGQIQQISMPQSVAAQVSDDVLYWPAGYGAGRHFKYMASPSRLNKLLIIDSAASLPATSYDTLELNFIMGMSSGVTPYIDSGSGLAAWDKKTQKYTVKAIEFRLSNGTVVWSFSVPTAYDSSGLPEGATTGTMRLKKQGGSLYVSVRFPKSWIDTAVFPIVLDPTVDYQVGASADGGYWLTFLAMFSIDTYNIVGSISGYPVNMFSRFTGVTIPTGATITAAKIQLYFQELTGSDPKCTIYADDQSNPSAVSGASNGDGRTKTTANVAAELPESGTWWDSPELKTIIQELVDSYSYASGSAMQFLLLGDVAGSGYISVHDDDDFTKAAKLSITYTEAAAGKPAANVIWIG